MDTLRIRSVMRFWICCCIAFILVGCSSFQRFVDTLNERQLSSCICYEGDGGGIARGMGCTVTGGADLAQCIESFGDKL